MHFSKNPNQQGCHFDWEGFKRVISDQDAENINISSSSTTSMPLQGTNVNVSRLVDKVMALLPELLPKDVVDQFKMRNELTSSLTDLDGLTEGFWREYATIVGVPSSLPNYLNSIMATVTAHGCFKEESGSWTPWRVYEPKIIKELNANITVMQLVVAKDFTSPLNQWSTVRRFSV